MLRNPKIQAPSLLFLLFKNSMDWVASSGGFLLIPLSFWALWAFFFFFFFLRNIKDRICK